MILPAVAGHVRGGGEIPMRAQSLCPPDSFPIRYLEYLTRRGQRQILRFYIRDCSVFNYSTAGKPSRANRVYYPSGEIPVDYMPETWTPALLEEGGQTMPNHVTNVLEFDCSRERAKEILEFLRNGDDVLGSIDFNKLIPMPESLNMEAGSETDRGIEIYLTAVNPGTKSYGHEKMNIREFRSLSRRLDNERHFNSYETQLSEEDIRKYTEGKSFDEVFAVGERAVSNMVQYGATTWYTWRI